MYIKEMGGKNGSGFVTVLGSDHMTVQAVLRISQLVSQIDTYLVKESVIQLRYITRCFFYVVWIGTGPFLQSQQFSGVVLFIELCCVPACMCLEQL